MNENQKKEIAKATISYLKNRMMINQKLISMSDNQIDFEAFMTPYNKYLKIIDYVEEHSDEMEDSDENQISFAEKIVQLKEDFVRDNVDSIVMTEEEIDELMLYIKESIEKYGLNSTYFYNENDFMRKVLSQLVEKMSETKDETTDEKIKRVKNFLTFTQIDENVGFCQTIEGHIFYDNDGKFCISTHNLKRVCEINKEGINEITSNELDDEDFLIADKIYVGYLTDNENALYIFLEKTVNGQRKMKEISETQEIYDILGEKNKNEKITPIKRVVLYDKINDFFKKLEVPFFAFNSNNIYMKNSFWETIEAFNKYRHMSLDERNEIENIVEISTSWWIDSLSSHSFDSGMEGVDENLNLLEEMLPNNITISKEKEMQKFKDVLGNRIRILLLSRPTFVLRVDYRPEDELACAVKESKLRGIFPVKTWMDISRDKIKVKKGFSSPPEVIYLKDMNKRK